MPDTEHFSRHFLIDAAHPSLAGHFPGHPVVPGVLVLDHVVAAAEDWAGRALGVSSLGQVKFVQPLLPGERAEIDLQRTGARYRFTVRRGDSVLARGDFEASR